MPLCRPLPYEEGWPMYPTGYCRNDSVWLSRMDHKRYCGFRHAHLDCLFWGSELSWCGDTLMQLMKRPLCGETEFLPTTTSNGQTQEWITLHPPGPADILTTTSWETLSQSHTTKQLLNSWPIKLRGNKCLFAYYVPGIHSFKHC